MMCQFSRSNSNLLSLLFLFILAIGISSCSEDSRNPVSSESADPKWETGEAVTRDLAGGEADISPVLPGARVTAPPGAGTIDIATVESGPLLSFSAARFEIAYDGSAPLSISVPREPGDETVLFAYGPLERAAIDGRRGIVDWWSVPAAAVTDSSVTFPLPFGAPGTGKAALTADASGGSRFAVAALPASSSDAMRLAAIRTSVRQVVDYWLGNLPSTLAEDAREQVEGDLAYTISWSNHGNAYQHGDNWIASNAVFYLTRDVEIDIIAHEVGHYMTHVLCGYDRYEEIYSRFPTNFWGAGMQHGIGDYREGRRDLLEDYAYFSTYIITDALQAVDLKKPPMWTLFKNHRPSEVDYPSHEGYGAAMLGTLLRAEQEVHTFDKNKPAVPAPAVNAPLSDVLGILARGPRDVNELREFISEYLAGRGTAYQYMLPAILEPIGWSYNGMGAVRYDDGTVVDDASVRAVCQTGEGEYLTTISTQTGPDGTYLLPRIYPGANLLRVYYNGGRDSTDVAFAVGWEAETNTALTIPDIVIPKEKQEEVTLTGTFSKEREFHDGQIIISVNGEWTATGTGFEMESDRDGDFIFACSPGAKGTIVINSNAEIVGHSAETYFFNQRNVHTYYDPVMVEPIEDHNYIYDEGVILNATGAGNTSSYEFEFPADLSHGSFQMHIQFRVYHDTVSYNKDNEIVYSSTELERGYSYSHYYFHLVR